MIKFLKEAWVHIADKVVKLKEIIEEIEVLKVQSKKKVLKKIIKEKKFQKVKKVV